MSEARVGLVIEDDQDIRELVRTVLTQAGCSLADVVRTTVYVASGDQRDLVAAWEVVRAAFGDWDPPSTLLGVATLGWTGQLVEVEATAVRRTG